MMDDRGDGGYRKGENEQKFKVTGQAMKDMGDWTTLLGSGRYVVVVVI